jgi:hypothetical protein
MSQGVFETSPVFRYLWCLIFAITVVTVYEVAGGFSGLESKIKFCYVSLSSLSILCQIIFSKLSDMFTFVTG